MKLKDLKYEIKGTDSNRPAMECLSAIVLGMCMPIFYRYCYTLNFRNLNPSLYEKRRLQKRRTGDK